MRRILLIEDDKILQVVTGDILEALDCAVDLADSGTEALLFCKKYNYDIIFLDLGLPDIEGCELAVKLKTEGFKGPIIACTARMVEEASRHCFGAGMKGFLQKPVSLDTFRDTLNRYLEQVA